MDVIGGGVIRTARKIMDGQVFVPAKAFSGEKYTWSNETCAGEVLRRRGAV
jgi:hypothetical protein